MSARVRTAAAAAVAGATVGCLFSARWVVTLYTSGIDTRLGQFVTGDEPLSVAVVCVTTLLGCWACWRLLRPPAAVLIRWALSLICGAVACAVVAAGTSSFGLDLDADTLWGAQVARNAASYSAPPSAVYYLSLLAPLLLCGLLTGVSAGLVAGARLPRAAVQGSAAGMLAGVAVASLQTLAFFTSMRSGHNPALVLLTSVAACAAVAAAFAAAVHEIRSRTGLLLPQLAPVLVLVIISAYCLTSGSGWAEYARIKKLYPDLTYSYIHFSADGTWRRTLDQSASATKAWRAQWFLQAYPWSAYRPTAMLLAAESEFEVWHFDEASRLLRELSWQYPLLDGYRSVLHALSDLAAGNPRTILRRPDAGGHFANWRATQGAQLAASAARRLGLANRASGYQSAYIDYLLSRQRTSWTSEAVAFARLQADLVRQRSGGGDLRRRGTVVARVTARGRPVRGARVVLVQPHYDAALPADSRQFTGAWTVPAWNGFWTTTDKNGFAIIPDVPYDRYEVVLGLDFRLPVHGYVVSSAIPPVHVDGERVVTKPIELVPAVITISPRPGEEVPASAQLAWKDYPGAAFYSVSVIAIGDTRQPRSVTSSEPTGTTCWARSRIRATRTSITPAYFVNGHSSVKSGWSYMWIVYAHRRDGSLLSSSEHYFELREPAFTIR